jgi:CheY-like chemotaxis protein
VVAAAAPELEPPAMSLSLPPKAKLNVFLVEDNADTRFLITYLLEQAGYEVHEAATMQAALRGYPQWRSEVLLSDIGLPDGTGCQLLEELRRNGEAPYAIAMSGFGTSSDVAASLAAGFRHHLVKPIETTTLERLLEQAGDEIRAVR